MQEVYQFLSMEMKHDILLNGTLYFFRLRDPNRVPEGFDRCLLVGDNVTIYCTFTDYPDEDGTFITTPSGTEFVRHQSFIVVAPGIQSFSCGFVDTDCGNVVNTIRAIAYSKLKHLE